MNSKKNKLFYNTPLNLSRTIDLPSNLLQSRMARNTYHNLFNKQQNIEKDDVNIEPDVSPRQFIDTIKEKKQKNVLLIQEKSKSKRNVLYKRLSDIKGQNQELQKYSYSKLLSKMVIVDPKDQYKSVDFDHQNARTISQYSCLRGKLLNMDCKDELTIRPNTKDRYSSGCSDYYSRTTRIFKRYYMPSAQKNHPSLNESSIQQKYIYINGKKTECKRIHNFYTSQNFRTSYDKAFGKTKDSFYSRKDKQF